MYISSYPPETLLEENYFDINTNLSVFEKREFIGALNESIDVDEGFGNVLRPVFIVLTYMDSTFDKVVEKFVKGQKYWHAGISFGPSLKNIYSFNYGNAAMKNVNKFTGGISFESIDLYKNENSNGTLEVSCILLGKDKYGQLKDTLNYYIKNKEKTKYDFINLLKSLFGIGSKDEQRFNLVCSTFVDTILKSVDINISKAKNINLTKPDDLRVLRRNEKQFKIYLGKVGNYNIDRAARKVDRLTQDVNNDYFKDKNSGK